MATVVRELVATFALDVDEKSFEKADQGIEQVIKGAKVLGALITTGALAVGFRNLIQVASDATENLNLLEVVFGEKLTPAILDWAGQTARAVNQSEFELRQFVGTAQAMLAPMLGSADAAARFSTEVVEAAIDLESLRNIPVAEAFSKIQSALVGVSRPLLNLGIDTRELAFDQFLQAKGIAESNKELGVQQRQMLRVQFVLQKLKFVQGDAARTANDFKNVQRGVASGLLDISTRIGQLFLPAMTRTAIATRRTVVAVRDWIELNQEWLEQNIGGAFSALVQVIDNVIKGFGQTIGFFVGLIDKLSPMQKGILGVVAAIAALAFIMTLPFAPIIALIALIGLIIDDLVIFGEGGKSVFGDLVDSVKGFAASAGIDLGAFFDFFEKSWGFVSDAAKIAWDFIVEQFDVAAEAAGPVIDSIVEVFKDGFEVIKEFVDDIFDFDKDQAISDFKEVVDRVRGFFATLLKNPLVKLVIAAIGAKLGAAAGEFIGEKIGALAGGLLDVSIVKDLNDIIEDLTGFNVKTGVTKFVGSGIGKLVGIGVGAVGGFTAAGALGEALAVTETGAAGGLTGAGILGGALGVTEGANINSPTEINASFDITQLPGESGQELAERVVSGISGLFSGDAGPRDVIESFVPSSAR